MAKKRYSFLVIALACMVLGGCSFSTSSKHSSKSSSSPCRSSSQHSNDGEDIIEITSNSYQEEVASLTALHVGTQSESIDFQRELGQISRGYGIADWEHRMKTYDAIGMGLQRANVSLAEVDTLQFLQGLSDSEYYPHITNVLD